MRTLDDARNVGHDERLVVADLDNTEVRLQRREGVVGDLGLRGRNDREQRRLARIGEAHQPHVGQHLQFEDERAFLPLLTRLGVARRLIRGTLEMPVAQTAPAAPEQHEPLAVGRHLAHRFGGRGPVLALEDALGDRAQRNRNHDVAGVLARRTRPGAVLAVLGELVALVFEVDECPVLLVALQDDAAALAAVTAVGTAERHEFLAAEMRRAAAAVTRAGEYLYVIYEIGTCHVISLFLKRQRYIKVGREQNRFACSSVKRPNKNKSVVTAPKKSRPRKSGLPAIRNNGIKSAKRRNRPPRRSNGPFRPAPRGPR